MATVATYQSAIFKSGASRPSDVRNRTV